MTDASVLFSKVNNFRGIFLGNFTDFCKQYGADQRIVKIQVKYFQRIY